MMNAEYVVAITHHVQIVLVYLMVILMKIIVALVIMMPPMTVIWIVLATGVVI